MISKESQSKHWASKDLRTIQAYYDSPPGILRSHWLVEQLKRFDFNSILEVGVFSGRNLKYIGETFSNVKLAGIDVNEKAVKFAQQKLPNVDLRRLDLHNIKDMSEKFDIIFTMGVLIHIPPSDISGVLNDLIRMTNKYLIHIETTGPDTVSAGPKEMNPSYKISSQLQWNIELVEKYHNLGFESNPCISIICLLS